jgi:ubiquinone biosynthesis protein UbiJ
VLEARLNRALNSALAESSRAQVLCAVLANRRLRVIMTGSPWAATLESDGSQVQARIGNAGDAGRDPASPAADATIAGSALSLLGLMGDEQRTLIQRGSVQISGDGEVAQKFAELAALLRPDVEQQLASVVGRVPAHLLWQGVRGVFSRGRALASGQLRNAADYLSHERRELVPQAEAEHFYRQVDALREQVDRVEAAITHLEQRL